ncbi:DEAD/DEAH box helicase [Bacteroidia bacterium]|jgi:ATP-dependent RNA helicase RhlE|nr:DEAD/DEAH box helicase [Bacteroidia bacterium]MDC0105282.1 DEAD/DEAH box helicase [Bacteroidia bacterium]MDC1430719.1 DEAD/DEAH box helicase [Bacteroidia bacterium]
MESFEELNINRQLLNAVADLGFEKPTPIQEEAYPVGMSGQNIVGIAQTGTGKTLAYMLPILQQLKYSKDYKPRVIILVPTRELVVQVVEQIELFTKYMSTRVLGVYGGVNIKTQMGALTQGQDIVVGTPGRLYDLAVNRSLLLQDVKKLVIDEVDVMLDLGFRFQLNNIFELLPDKRQNIMFSATMTEDVEILINENFIKPEFIAIALSGTPLDNIYQSCYPVANFYTKVNLLGHLLQDKETYQKILIFIDSKKNADRLYEAMEPDFWNELLVIHSNKSQNNRMAAIERFNDNNARILIATDVIARGLDLDDITHVINFDTPKFPENYMHRIGRTGRAEKMGHSILFYTEGEEDWKKEIEKMMEYDIPQLEFPTEVKVSKQLTLDEQPRIIEKNPHKKKTHVAGPSFHDKKDKNKKDYNLGGGQKIKIKKAKKYKNPISRGQKPKGKEK